jgi:hypothetical protein
MEPANRQFIPQAARPSSRAALCVIEPLARQASYPSIAARNPAGRAAFPKRTLTNYFTRALDEGSRETPPLSLFTLGAGFSSRPISLCLKLQSVRSSASRSDTNLITRDKGDAVLFEHARALGPKFQTAN